MPEWRKTLPDFSYNFLRRRATQFMECVRKNGSQLHGIMGSVQGASL